MERLNKVIAQAGLTSRRGADALITEGRISINGAIVRQLGSVVDPVNDIIKVDGVALPVKKITVTYAFYKPRGVVTSTKRQKKEKIVTDFLPSEPPLYPIGRLDRESEGLLLLTNDGDLANTLTHPSFEHEKEYLVTCRPDSSESQLSAEKVAKTLLKGVKLGDGPAKADRVTATQEGSELILRITVHEGRTHLIRRMCACVNLSVVRLVRIRIGSFSPQLKPGAYRKLTIQDLSLLND